MLYEVITEQSGDFEQWIVNGLGDHPFEVIVVDPRNTDVFPAIESVAGAIITGSHSMVTDREPWSENLASWLRSAVSGNTPILGICYGHQLLAHAMGGGVNYHPKGIELGTVPICLTSEAKDDPLFHSLPNSYHFVYCMLYEVITDQEIARPAILEIL